MKHETKQTRHAAEETVSSAIELSQKTAEVVLDSAVKTAEMTDNYVRSAMQLGLNAQEAGINIAKNYLDNIARINREWINLFAVTGERAIDSVGDSIKKPVSDAFKNSAQAAENAQAQAKHAAK